ncbi:MAG: NUDIX domain-containing protein [Betaproteobacteria bacterium]|nr:NUDIX domain-containing protein [Betaproteobacteria bacterium]
MASFLFSANDLKMHPFFARDTFENFEQQVRPLILSFLKRTGAESPELEQLLLNIRANMRETLPAHLTTSSVVLSPDRSELLFLFHKKIKEWVYPGGHADGDWHLLRSALRECFEETGLPAVEVIPPHLCAEQASAASCPHLFQRFEIKATALEPAHVHYDAVFVFQADTRQVDFEPQESSGSRWMTIASLKAHALRPEGQIVDGFDSLTARVCLSAMQSALGSV